MCDFNKKVFYSRDVSFCENDNGRAIGDSQEVLTEKYVELGFSDEEGSLEMESQQSRSGQASTQEQRETLPYTKDHKTASETE